MMTRDQLLESLLLERFTHLPQSPAWAYDVGPSAELIRLQRRDAAAAAQIVLAFPRRPDVVMPVVDQRSVRAIS